MMPERAVDATTSFERSRCGDDTGRSTEYSVRSTVLMPSSRRDRSVVSRVQMVCPFPS